jgi:hypothetical protein
MTLADFNYHADGILLSSSETFLNNLTFPSFDFERT